MQSAVALCLIRQRLVQAAVIPYRIYAGIAIIFPTQEESAIAVPLPIRVTLEYGIERARARAFHADQIIIPIMTENKKEHRV